MCSVKELWNVAYLQLLLIKFWHQCMESWWYHQLSVQSLTTHD